MRLNLTNFRIPKDTLWKLIIEGETEPCLRFFFPLMAAQIDFSKGIRFLGEEFFKLFPELNNDTQNRRLDKLIEVTLKTGETQWLLIHIEVQGYVDAEFTRRMFEYFYRILEKYQKPATALAIFTDDDPNFHPTEHRIFCWGTEMVYSFNTYKLAEKHWLTSKIKTIYSPLSWKRHGIICEKISPKIQHSMTSNLKSFVASSKWAIPKIASEIS